MLTLSVKRSILACCLVSYSRLRLTNDLKLKLVKWSNLILHPFLNVYHKIQFAYLKRNFWNTRNSAYTAPFYCSLDLLIRNNKQFVVVICDFEVTISVRNFFNEEPTPCMHTIRYDSKQSKQAVLGTVTQVGSAMAASQLIATFCRVSPYTFSVAITLQIDEVSNQDNTFEMH